MKSQFKLIEEEEYQRIQSIVLVSVTITQHEIVDFNETNFELK